MPDQVGSVSGNSGVHPSGQTSSSNGIGLDKDAFLKLLLASIKYQDPFSPMDSDKMLQQFTLLTVVERMLEISDDLKEIKEVLKQISAGMSSANATTAARIYKANQG